MLSETQVKEFQNLYKQRFGRDISREEAYEKGVSLIRLIKILAKPKTENDSVSFQKEKKDDVDI
ncbi:MAG: hypothetical protein V2A65_02900 [Candidatus Omnitrophota bacterium]